RQQPPIALEACQRQREPAPRPRLLGSRLPSHEVQAGLRAIARRGSLSDLAAVPVEQRERQGEPDGRQEAPLPSGVAVVEAYLETGGREHAAVGEGQRAIRRAEGRRRRATYSKMSASSAVRRDSITRANAASARV